MPAESSRFVPGRIDFKTDYDADSFWVNTSAGRIELRLSGVDAPETAHNTDREQKIGQPGGDAASAIMRQIVGGNEILIQSREVDARGRIVSTVFVSTPQGLINLNQELIRQSAAHPMTGKYFDASIITPDIQETYLNNFQQGLLGKGKGIFADMDNLVSPEEFRNADIDLGVFGTIENAGPKVGLFWGRVLSLGQLYRPMEVSEAQDDYAVRTAADRTGRTNEFFDFVLTADKSDDYFLPTTLGHSYQYARALREKTWQGQDWDGGDLFAISVWRTMARNRGLDTSVVPKEVLNYALELETRTLEWEINSLLIQQGFPILFNPRRDGISNLMGAVGMAIDRSFLTLVEPAIDRESEPFRRATHYSAPKEGPFQTMLADVTDKFLAASTTVMAYVTIGVPLGVLAAMGSSAISQSMIDFALNSDLSTSPNYFYRVTRGLTQTAASFAALGPEFTTPLFYDGNVETWQQQVEANRKKLIQHLKDMDSVVDARGIQLKPKDDSFFQSGLNLYGLNQAFFRDRGAFMIRNFMRPFITEVISPFGWREPGEQLRNKIEDFAQEVQRPASLAYNEVADKVVLTNVGYPRAQKVARAFDEVSGMLPLAFWRWGFGKDTGIELRDVITLGDVFSLSKVVQAVENFIGDSIEGRIIRSLPFDVHESGRLGRNVRSWGASNLPAKVGREIVAIGADLVDGVDSFVAQPIRFMGNFIPQLLGIKQFVFSQKRQFAQPEKVRAAHLDMFSKSRKAFHNLRRAEGSIVDGGIITQLGDQFLGNLDTSDEVSKGLLKTYFQAGAGADAALAQYIDDAATRASQITGSSKDFERTRILREFLDSAAARTKEVGLTTAKNHYAAGKKQVRALQGGAVAGLVLIDALMAWQLINDDMHVSQLTAMETTASQYEKTGYGIELSITRIFDFNEFGQYGHRAATFLYLGAAYAFSHWFAANNRLMEFQEVAFNRNVKWVEDSQSLATLTRDRLRVRTYLDQSKFGMKPRSYLTQVVVDDNQAKLRDWSIDTYSKLDGKRDYTFEFVDTNEADIQKLRVRSRFDPTPQDVDFEIKDQQVVFTFTDKQNKPFEVKLDLQLEGERRIFGAVIDNETVLVGESGTLPRTAGAGGELETFGMRIKRRIDGVDALIDRRLVPRAARRVGTQALAFLVAMSLPHAARGMFYGGRWLGRLTGDTLRLFGVENNIAPMNLPAMDLDAGFIAQMQEARAILLGQIREKMARGEPVTRLELQASLYAGMIAGMMPGDRSGGGRGVRSFTAQSPFPTFQLFTSIQARGDENNQEIWSLQSGVQGPMLLGFSTSLGAPFSVLTGPNAPPRVVWNEEDNNITNFLSASTATIMAVRGISMTLEGAVRGYGSLMNWKARTPWMNFLGQTPQFDSRAADSFFRSLNSGRFGINTAEMLLAKVMGFPVSGSAALGISFGRAIGATSRSAGGAIQMAADLKPNLTGKGLASIGRYGGYAFLGYYFGSIAGSTIASVMGGDYDERKRSALWGGIALMGGGAALAHWNPQGREMKNIHLVNAFEEYADVGGVHLKNHWQNLNNPFNTALEALKRGGTDNLKKFEQYSKLSEVFRNRRYRRGAGVVLGLGVAVAGLGMEFDPVVSGVGAAMAFHSSLAYLQNENQRRIFRTTVINEVASQQLTELSPVAFQEFRSRRGWQNSRFFRGTGMNFLMALTASLAVTDPKFGIVNQNIQETRWSTVALLTAFGMTALQFARFQQSPADTAAQFAKRRQSRWLPLLTRIAPGPEIEMEYFFNQWQQLMPSSKASVSATDQTAAAIRRHYQTNLIAAQVAELEDITALDRNVTLNQHLRAFRRAGATKEAFEQLRQAVAGSDELKQFSNILDTPVTDERFESIVRRRAARVVGMKNFQKDVVESPAFDDVVGDLGRAWSARGVGTWRGSSSRSISIRRLMVLTGAFVTFQTVAGFMDNAPGTGHLSGLQSFYARLDGMGLEGVANALRIVTGKDHPASWSGLHSFVHTPQDARPVGVSQGRLLRRLAPPTGLNRVLQNLGNATFSDSPNLFVSQIPGLSGLTWRRGEFGFRTTPYFQLQSAGQDVSFAMYSLAATFYLNEVGKGLYEEYMTGRQAFSVEELKSPSPKVRKMAMRRLLGISASMPHRRRPRSASGYSDETMAVIRNDSLVSGALADRARIAEGMNWQTSVGLFGRIANNSMDLAPTRTLLALNFLLTGKYREAVNHLFDNPFGNHLGEGGFFDDMFFQTDRRFGFTYSISQANRGFGDATAPRSLFDTERDPNPLAGMIDFLGAGINSMRSLGRVFENTPFEGVAPLGAAIFTFLAVGVTAAGVIGALGIPRFLAYESAQQRALMKATHQATSVFRPFDTFNIEHIADSRFQVQLRGNLWQLEAEQIAKLAGATSQEQINAAVDDLMDRKNTSDYLKLARTNLERRAQAMLNAGANRLGPQGFGGFNTGRNVFFDSFDVDSLRATTYLLEGNFLHQIDRTVSSVDDLMTDRELISLIEHFDEDGLRDFAKTNNVKFEIVDEASSSTVRFGRDSAPRTVTISIDKKALGVMTDTEWNIFQGKMWENFKNNFLEDLLNSMFDGLDSELIEMASRSGSPGGIESLKNRLRAKAHETFNKALADHAADSFSGTTFARSNARTLSESFDYLGDALVTRVMTAIGLDVKTNLGGLLTTPRPAASAFFELDTLRKTVSHFLFNQDLVEATGSPSAIGAEAIQGGEAAPSIRARKPPRLGATPRALLGHGLSTLATTFGLFEALDMAGSLGRGLSIMRTPGMTTGMLRNATLEIGHVVSTSTVTSLSVSLMTTAILGVFNKNIYTRVLGGALIAVPWVGSMISPQVASGMESMMDSFSGAWSAFHNKTSEVIGGFLYGAEELMKNLLPGAPTGIASVFFTTFVVGATAGFTLTSAMAGLGFFANTAAAGGAAAGATQTMGFLGVTAASAKLIIATAGIAAIVAALAYAIYPDRVTSLFKALAGVSEGVSNATGGMLATPPNDYFKRFGRSLPGSPFQIMTAGDAIRQSHRLTMMMANDYSGRSIKRLLVAPNLDGGWTDGQAVTPMGQAVADLNMGPHRILDPLIDRELIIRGQYMLHAIGQGVWMKAMIESTNYAEVKKTYQDFNEAYKHHWAAWLKKTATKTNLTATIGQVGAQLLALATAPPSSTMLAVGNAPLSAEVNALREQYGKENVEVVMSTVTKVQKKDDKIVIFKDVDLMNDVFRFAMPEYDPLNGLV